MVVVGAGRVGADAAAVEADAQVAVGFEREQQDLAVGHFGPLEGLVRRAVGIGRSEGDSVVSVGAGHGDAAAVSGGLGDATEGEADHLDSCARVLIVGRTGDGHEVVAAGGEVGAVEQVLQHDGPAGRDGTGKAARARFVQGEVIEIGVTAGAGADVVVEQ